MTYSQLTNLTLTVNNLDQIGQLSNRDLLDLHGHARDFQALALVGTNANAIRYGCDLKMACVHEMKQRTMKGA